jgi:protein TonB
MKTTNSAIGIAVHAGTLDEIVFENRNHEYGAYNLRKNYSTHLFVALLFIALLFGSSSFVALWKYMQLPPPEVVTDKPFVLPPEPINGEVQKIEVPQFEPTKTSTTTSQYSIPVVVDEVVETAGEASKPDLTLPDDAVNNTGLLAFTPAVNNDNVIEVNNEGFRAVEIQAMFEGGDVKLFNAWVQKNVDFPDEASACNVSGPVYVDFAVNSQGEVCDIKILKSPHKSLSNEVIRTIKKSPKWIPAKQNGNDVKQLFSMKINFMLHF